jgi:hypothetical protein
MTPWYPPTALLTAMQGYQPSAGTGGFLLVPPPVEAALANPPFAFTSEPTP